jgi:hypothetical protein
VGGGKAAVLVARMETCLGDCGKKPAGSSPHKVTLELGSGAAGTRRAAGVRGEEGARWA